MEERSVSLLSRLVVTRINFQHSEGESSLTIEQPIPGKIDLVVELFDSRTRYEDFPIDTVEKWIKTLQGEESYRFSFGIDLCLISASIEDLSYRCERICLPEGETAVEIFVSTQGSFVVSQNELLKALILAKLIAQNI